MERWAANTLRTLGIILTAGFVLVTSLLFLLLSMCAAQGNIGGAKHPEQVVPYLFAAVAVLVAGIWFITWLARGIFRSMKIPELATAGVQEGAIASSEPSATLAKVDGPLHLSPQGRTAVDRLVVALGAQIVLSAIAWVFNQLHFWSAPPALGPHNWTLILLAPFLLYHLPYAILIYALLKRLDRRALAYALAVPSVMILQTLFSLGVVGYYYIHQPRGFLLLFLPWAIHIVILILAYQAIQRVGLHPEPSSLIVAAVVTFIFFTAIHALTPFLYRFTSLFSGR